MFENVIKKLKENLLHQDSYELSIEEIEKREFFKKNILSRREFGDYIWAVKEDMNFLDQEERICPYIVIDKTDDKIIACRVTKNPTKDHSFEINKDDQKNNAYVLYSDIKAIDYVSYRHSKIYFGKSLTEEEKKKLRSSLSSLGDNVFYKDLGEIKSTKIETSQEYNIGDVLLSPNGISTLIIDILDDGSYSCINLNSYDVKTNMINFNEENIDFFNRFILYKRDYRFLGTIQNNQLIVVLNKYSEYLKKVDEYNRIKETFVLVRGAIIRRVDKFYYVNTIESKKAKLFLLEPTNQNDPDALNFGNLFFKPHYNETSEIDEKDLMSYPIRIASEEEIEIVKKDKKSKSKIKKQSNNNIKQPKKQNKIVLKDGDIIESNRFYNNRFLILGFYENKIITISLDDYVNGKTVIIEFYENDDSIYLSNNVTLEDRAVIEFNQNNLYELFDSICNKKDNTLSMKKDV